MEAPLTLAVETSTPVGSVALGSGQRLLAEIVIAESARHSELLLPAIDQLFHYAGAAHTQLGRIVVGGGPGSFTGLRVAAATAKGLAAALDLPVLAFPGLLAVAAGTGLHGRVVCTLFDARRNEVYAACYRIADRIETIMAPRVDEIEQVLAAVEPASLVFAGDGALRHSQRIAAAGGIVLPAAPGLSARCHAALAGGHKRSGRAGCGSAPLGTGLPARLQCGTRDPRMTDAITFRGMRLADLPRVLEIELQCFTMPWSEATFRGLLRRSDADLYVAEAGEHVVGYSVFWAVLDQGELGNVSVAPGWRRRGIGQGLVRKVLLRARERGVRDVFLEVRVSNTGAQRLYESYGFAEVGRRRNYYLEPLEDALVMRRELDVLPLLQLGDLI